MAHIQTRIHCQYTRLADPKTLIAHPKNRNTHSTEQVDRLVKILQYQGFRYAIKVSKQSGYITSGHGRVMAALKMGLTQVPIDDQDYDSDEQEYADVQADNAIASWAELDLSAINDDLGTLGPDFDIDWLGIKGFEIDVAEKFDPQSDEDEIPEHVEPKTKLGDIYQLGRHRLMCGDSTSIDAVEKLFGSGQAKLCFTSPPYTNQREYNGGKELAVEHLATFIRTAQHKVAYFAVNLGISKKNGEIEPYWNCYIKESGDCGLKLLSWNVWNKQECISLGAQAQTFALNHEWIFVFGADDSIKLNKTVPTKFGGDKCSDHGGGNKIRLRNGKLENRPDFTIGEFKKLSTCLSLNVDTTSRTGHPAVFPVALPEAYIEAMSDAGDQIYEPFGGSGSTLIACEKTNRQCFMMELDPHYCDVIVARWEKYTGQTAVLIATPNAAGKHG